MAGYILEGNTYRTTTRAKKIEEEALNFMNKAIGDAIKVKDCVKLEQLRYFFKNKKSAYAAEAVKGGFNEKRANSKYAEAASAALARVEVAFIQSSCAQQIEGMDAETLSRRQQEAFEQVDANLGSDLALKEYLIYGLGAAAVLFGTFFIILKRRKK